MTPPRIRKKLAIASLALSTSAASATTLPPEIVAEWIEVETALEERVAVLNVVDGADRKAVRARDAVDALLSRADLSSATQAAESFRDRAEALIRRMAQSSVASVRVAAPAAFGRLLELSPPSWRIELVCRWALSEHVAERTTIARALSLPTQVFVADLAISELARDQSSQVRVAVVRAVRSHFRTDPEAFARIAEDLVNDSDPAVRGAAREQLSTFVEGATELAATQPNHAIESFGGA